MALVALAASNLTAEEGPLFQSEAFSPPSIPDFTSLNIRLSERPVTPPPDMVKGMFDLTKITPARMLIGPSPKAAILEDDHHHRVLVLSPLEEGGVRTLLLADIDFSPRIPYITACTRDRACAHDRRPVTGGLGCIAICVQQALKTNPMP